MGHEEGPRGSPDLDPATQFPLLYEREYGAVYRTVRAMVLDAAEACIRQIIDLYAKPNMTVEEIRLAFERDRIDPIRDFSVGCRKELLEIAGGR